MSGYHVELEQKTLDNEKFREVLFTGPNCQLVVMALLPNEDIGMEVHEDHDQFIRVEAGEGKAIMDGEEFLLKDGSAIVIPAGTEHNVVNTSSEAKMKLYTVYSPPEHADGRINETKPAE